MTVKSAGSSYSCRECGAQASQWSGKCFECGAWDSLEECHDKSAGNQRSISSVDGKPLLIKDIVLKESPKISTGNKELNRVLGGGVVQGSVVLLGGDPGIGKSTLLLQALEYMGKQGRALYVSGEESLQQIGLRARRLGARSSQLKLFSETDVEKIIAVAEQEKSEVMVVDSIQTVVSSRSQSIPGSVSQVRECAARLVTFAKQSGTALFLVGHVTKEGTLAGPRILEHMVDTVLYFEGDSGSKYRVVRAIKNRFGAVNELGVFVMAEDGLREVNNPSAIFLSRHDQDVAGSVVMVAHEGSRHILVEVQALVAESHAGNPRRVTQGLDQGRLAMLLAVLQRHGGVATYDQDVFVNVVGGIKVSETAADLAVVLTTLSSLRGRPLPTDMVVFGEIGLAGEIRPVHNGQERLYEAIKHGFKRAIIPHANMPKKMTTGIEVIGARRLDEALSAI